MRNMNLLAILHHQYLFNISDTYNKARRKGLYRWVIYISSNGDFNYIDNVGVLQGTEEGDFSDGGDGSSITSLRGINPYRLKCDNLTRPAISCTTGKRCQHSSMLLGGGILDYSEC